MHEQAESSTPWRPGRQFWTTHFYLPLLAATAILTLLETTPVDLWIADRWYAWEGGAWSLRNHWFAYDVIHHHGKQMIVAIALTLIALLAFSSRSPLLRQWRRPMGYLLTCLIFLPGIVATLKHYTAIPCPWSVARYGGELAYQHNFSYPLGLNLGGNCFPSGHASGGFALVAVYFAAFRNVPRPGLWLLPGMLIGWTFALGQQSRGAHFLSHDLSTLAVCWFGALVLFLIIKPYCKPPVPAEDTHESAAGVPGSEPHREIRMI